MVAELGCGLPAGAPARRPLADGRNNNRCSSVASVDRINKRRQGKDEPELMTEAVYRPSNRTVITQGGAKTPPYFFGAAMMRTQVDDNSTATSFQSSRKR